MKKTIMSLLLLAVCAIGSATVTQKFYLKNGTMLNGFIKQQDMKGNITVKTESAVICLSSFDVETEDFTAKENGLTSEWKKWAEENDALTGYGADKTLTLSNVQAGVGMDSIARDPETMNFEERLKENGTQFRNVKILERGTNIRFLELAPNSYTIKWSDIDRIEGTRRPKNMLTGIMRTYTLKDGTTVKGEYAGETYETISVFKNDGTVETMPAGDIKSLQLAAINPNQDILEQSKLLDVITLKNGKKRTGVVTEQFNGGKTAAENYITLKESNGTTVNIRTVDAASLGKTENPAYKPVTDVILRMGEVMINRKKAAATEAVEKDGTLTLKEMPADAIRVKSNGQTATFFVEYNGNAGAEPFMVVKLSKTTTKKATSYSFSYKDLALSSYNAAKEERSVNGTVKKTFTLAGNSIYALYFKNTNSVMPVIAE